MQGFICGGEVDFEEAREGYHEKYGGALKVNADRAVSENNQEWSSSFYLLRLRRAEERKGKEMKGCHPARSAWGCRVTGRTVRPGGEVAPCREAGGYAVEEENRRLMIKDFNVELDFAGGLRRGGKGVRLEVYRDEAENAWYASVQLRVGAETTENGNESEHVVRGESRSIQVESSRGNEAASFNSGKNKRPGQRRRPRWRLFALQGCQD